MVRAKVREHGRVLNRRTHLHIARFLEANDYKTTVGIPTDMTQFRHMLGMPGESVQVGVLVAV
jgi:hypothetical protein